MSPSCQKLEHHESGSIPTRTVLVGRIDTPVKILSCEAVSIGELRYGIGLHLFYARVDQLITWLSASYHAVVSARRFSTLESPRPRNPGSPTSLPSIQGTLKGSPTRSPKLPKLREFPLDSLNSQNVPKTRISQPQKAQEETPKMQSPEEAQKIQDLKP